MDHKLTALAQLLLGSESRVRTFALVTTENSAVEPSDSQELTSGGDRLAAYLRSQQYAYAVLEQHTRAEETLCLIYNVGLDDVGFIWKRVDLDRFLLVELSPLGDSPRSMTLTCFQTLGSEAVRGRPDPKGSLYRQAGERMVCRDLASFCHVCEWHSLSITLPSRFERSTTLSIPAVGYTSCTLSATITLSRRVWTPGRPFALIVCVGRSYTGRTTTSS